MKTFGLMLAAAAVIAVNAECPNGCSGHGTCGANDACSCYDNWMGGDCSQRVCPFGLAFVDTPLGDLNHDGTVSSSSNVLTEWATTTGGSSGYKATSNEMWQGSSADEAHFYTECSGKGSCDRSSGECGCFDGFTGSSCQRTTCANDCSGHGQCYTLREIAAGFADSDRAITHSGSSVGRNFRIEDYIYGVYSTSGVSSVFDYNLWDADKNQACSCDNGYFGPDCSLRDCPRGRDPLTKSDTRFCGNDATCTSSVQYVHLYQQGASPAGLKFYMEWEDVEDYSQIGASKLRSSTFVLKGGMTGDEYAELFQDVLETFPNSVLNGVTVSCDASAIAGSLLVTHRKCDTAFAVDNDAVLLKVDFGTGPQGPVKTLKIRLAEVPATATMSCSTLTTPNTNTLAVVLPYVTSRVGSAGATTVGFYLGRKADGSLASISGGGLSTGVACSDAVPSSSAALAYADATGILAGESLTVSAPVSGNQPNSPCSNRGLCDYETGMCSCFSGYTREDCSVQSALAMNRAAA